MVRLPWLQFSGFTGAIGPVELELHGPIFPEELTVPREAAVDGENVGPGVRGAPV